MNNNFSKKEKKQKQIKNKQKKFADHKNKLWSYLFSKTGFTVVKHSDLNVHKKL